MPATNPPNVRVSRRAETRHPLLFVLCALCVLCGSPSARSAEPEVAAKDLPRLPAVEPKDAIATLKLRPGFRAEFAAHEPQVVSPVALAFDEDARMYVVEMIDYSERRDEHLGRIRLLEDTNGDGYYDKSTVFAEGFGWPTAVFPWQGGVFVACTPDILYLKDTNGDGKADDRRVVFTGFAEGVKRLNVQALLNSFNWRLDNRIHGATSMNGGHVTAVGPTNGTDAGIPTGKPLDLRGKNFAIDPRTMTITAENGGGQHGLSYDDFGRAYVTSNSRHIMSFAYDAKYADRNPAFTMPAPLVDIPADGPAAEVFRASPEEPWRVIRTKWRVSGISSGPIEGGGRSAGYFTGATGVTIYRGDAYGPEYLNNAFIGDAGGNLVHRKVITYPETSPLIPLARRAPDEQKSEFLASTDTWFRPVQFANGPDGCLYVIDMYRETIEHPWSLPESLKKHLDLNSGNDRGRIYRIVPDNFKRRPPVKLSKTTTLELVHTLTHANGWHRDTAARLLYERQDKSAVRFLERLLYAPTASLESPLSHLHGLYALDGLGALTPDHLIAALADPDERVRADVRAHVLRLAERFLGTEPAPAELVNWLPALAIDPSPRVRYQLAFTLGALPTPDLQLLAKIHASLPADPWLEAAVISSIGKRSTDFVKLLDTPDWRNTATALSLVPKLAEQIGASALGDDIAAVIELAERQPDDRRMMTLARALGNGLARAGLVIEAEKGDLLLQRAVALSSDPKADPETRLAAIGVLGRSTWDHHATDLLPLLDPRQGQAVQLAALTSLDQLDKGDLAPELLTRWPTLSPKLRESAAAAMVKRPARALALLETIRAGKIRPADLSGSQASALRQSPDKSVKALAAKVLTPPTGRREDVVKSFQPALDLRGDPARGHTLYQAKCSTCHRLAGEGTPLGPDLETVKNAGREKLLTNILDPNREVAPQYTAYVVETTDGDTQIGLISSETASTITLKMAAGAETTIPRDAIKSMRTSGLSLMPEGLEQDLKPQDFADLMDYITTAK